MRIEITEYLTANCYKALLIICKRRDISFSSIIPDLNLCNTDESLIFYISEKPVLTVIDRKCYDSEMKEIDLKGISINHFDKILNFNLLRKKQKNIVLISFNK